MLKKLGAALNWIPFKTMLVVVALCYVDIARTKEGKIKFSWGYAEVFPLSSFPMFSTFSSAGNLVYVVDEAGNPILPSTFNTSTGGMTKSYRKFLHERRKDFGVKFSEMTPEQKMEAGTNLLKNLRDSVAPEAFADGKLSKVQLIELIVTRDENGEILENRETVGELITPAEGVAE